MRGVSPTASSGGTQVPPWPTSASLDEMQTIPWEASPPSYGKPCRPARRGISPIISYVLLIAITIVGTAALYYWVSGAGTAPALTPSKTDIQVWAYNNSTLRVTNIGVIDTGEFDAMSTTAGNCTFAPATVLMPGVTYSCTLAAAASGSIQVWAAGVNPAGVRI